MRDRERRAAQRTADRANVEAAGGVYEEVYPDTDVGSGMAELGARGFWDHGRTVALAFGWDGALIVEKSNQNAWFIFLVNHNLPKEMRFKQGERLAAVDRFSALTSLLHWFRAPHFWCSHSW